MRCINLLARDESPSPASIWKFYVLKALILVSYHQAFSVSAELLVVSISLCASAAEMVNKPVMFLFPFLSYLFTISVDVFAAKLVLCLFRCPPLITCLPHSSQFIYLFVYLFIYPRFLSSPHHHFTFRFSTHVSLCSVLSSIRFEGSVAFIEFPKGIFFPFFFFQEQSAQNRALQGIHINSALSCTQNARADNYRTVGVIKHRASGCFEVWNEEKIDG